MKQVILTLALLVASGVANAQNTNVNPKHNNYKRETAAEENDFANTEMVLHSESIDFVDVPEMPKSIWAVITDAEGEMIKQGRISSLNSNIDIHRMDKGLYFVSIVYKNKTMKAFVLQKEQ